MQFFASQCRQVINLVLTNLLNCCPQTTDVNAIMMFCICMFLFFFVTFLKTIREKYRRLSLLSYVANKLILFLNF